MAATAPPKALDGLGELRYCAFTPELAGLGTTRTARRPIAKALIEGAVDNRVVREVVED